MGTVWDEEHERKESTPLGDSDRSNCCCWLMLAVMAEGTAGNNEDLFSHGSSGGLLALLQSLSGEAADGWRILSDLLDRELYVSGASYRKQGTEQHDRTGSGRGRDPSGRYLYAAVHDMFSSGTEEGESGSRSLECRHVWLICSDGPDLSASSAPVNSLWVFSARGT